MDTDPLSVEKYFLYKTQGWLNDYYCNHFFKLCNEYLDHFNRVHVLHRKCNASMGVSFSFFFFLWIGTWITWSCRFMRVFLYCYFTCLLPFCVCFVFTFDWITNFLRMPVVVTSFDCLCKIIWIPPDFSSAI